MTGIKNLWEEKNYLLAGVIFFFSVVFPAVKLGVLATAKVESGIYYFGAAILLAMTATTLESHLARRSKASYYR